MKHERKKTSIINAVSELKDANYSKNPELENIYRRLVNGRKKFAEILSKNIKAVMQISSLDLTMRHQTEKIDEIAQSVANATEAIFGNSENFDDMSSNQHEELTNTIIHASSQTEEIYKKIETSQNELTNIKDLSSQTIQISQTMQTDLNDLSEVIDEMNNMIASIDSISFQTNILALNASIEAARAGAAGRGFAVVATEIHTLAAQTREMTKKIDELVEAIRAASKKSITSASTTIESLSTMTDKIENIWSLNAENQEHVATVNGSMSSIAALSEEITSTMSEMEDHLRNSTDFMNTVSQDLQKATEPVIEIEKTLDDTVKLMGSMSNDPFYHIENHEFAVYVKNAITAHRTWLGNLEKIAVTKTLSPLQLDAAKCGFGHFYNAVTPKVPAMLPVWINLGAKHKRFHQYGAELINAIKQSEFIKAEQLYNEAENYSKELIADLNKLIHLAN